MICHDSSDSALSQNQDLIQSVSDFQPSLTVTNRRLQSLAKPSLKGLIAGTLPHIPPVTEAAAAEEAWLTLPKKEKLGPQESQAGNSRPKPKITNMNKTTHTHAHKRYFMYDGLVLFKQ